MFTFAIKMAKEHKKDYMVAYGFFFYFSFGRRVKDDHMCSSSTKIDGIRKYCHQ